MVEVFRPLMVDEVKEFYEVLYANMYAEYGLPREAIHGDMNVVTAGRKVAIRDKGKRKIIATGIVYLSEPDEARLTDVSVEKAYRRRGVGSLLVRELERVAFKAGALKVKLISTLPAISFYQRLGYAKVTDTFIQYEDHKVPAYTMANSLFHPKL